MAPTTVQQRLAAWREVEETGDLAAAGDERAALLGALAGRWHQVLAVEVDLLLDTVPPGEERLRGLATGWLDVCRRTAPVRALLRHEPVAADARQRGLFRTLLAEDLATLGVPAAQRPAADLLAELDAVAQLEDRAGRVLRRERRALVTGLVSAPPSRSRACFAACRRVVAA